MNSGINLLQRKPTTLSGSFTKQMKFIRFIALLLLFIVPTGTIILFLFIFFSPLPALQQQEKSLLASANILEQKTASLEFINERVDDSMLFTAKRVLYKQALQELIAQLPSGVAIGTLSTQNNQLTLVVISTSLSLLKSYQDNLANLHGSGQFLHAITFQAISLIQAGAGYQMTLTASII